jgi:hypothetical protein
MCQDLEAAAKVPKPSDALVCAAWAPMLNHKRERVAIARGNFVYILSIVDSSGGADMMAESDGQDGCGLSVVQVRAANSVASLQIFIFAA